MRRNIELERKLLEFLYKWLRPIRIGDLRKELKKENITIAHSTLNSIFERLESEGFVEWEKYGPVSLTVKGKQAVTHTKRHYHLCTMFLANTLDISHETAEKESYKIADRLSCDIIGKIAQRLEKPKRCICNEKIPNVKECSTKL